MQYSGSELNPIFYAEISSTHLFYDIFDKHPGIAKAFIEQTFNVEVEKLLVIREKFYPGRGSIDLFFDFHCRNRRCALLLEA